MSTEAPDKSDKSEGGDATHEPSRTAPPSPVATPKDKRNTTGPKKRFCERWKAEIEGIAVLAAVIYAVYTVKEWHTFDSERKTMESEFRMAQNNAQLEQRAWIGISNVQTSQIGEIGQPIFHIGINNSGRTPGVITNIMAAIALDGTNQCVATMAGLTLAPSASTDVIITFTGCFGAERLNLWQNFKFRHILTITFGYQDVFRNAHNTVNSYIIPENAMHSAPFDLGTLQPGTMD